MVGSRQPGRIEVEIEGPIILLCEKIHGFHHAEEVFTDTEYRTKPRTGGLSGSLKALAVGLLGLFSHRNPAVTGPQDEDSLASLPPQHSDMSVSSFRVFESAIRNVLSQPLADC